MNIDNKTIWQHAAGDTKRNYVDLCLKWDVVLNGPSKEGAWPDCEKQLRHDKWTERKITGLRRFCEEMSDGDIVVLRMGTNSVYGVGHIVDEYQWNPCFNDVDGWDIGHVWRVRWLWKYTDRNSGKPKTFDTYTLKLGDTTQKLDSEEVKSWLKSLDITSNDYDRSLPDLPEENDCAEISIESISEELFDAGMASNSISSLLDEMGELTRIAKWYDRSGEAPSEHETVSYLVVPLLRALGWTPQKMAIEWNNIDVALFSGVPRDKKYLSVVVEAKKIHSASLSALSQAAYYAESYEKCQRIILTDGLRYGVFVKNHTGSDDENEFFLHAYMNLTDLRDKYPIYDCLGAREVLLKMSPTQG